MGELGVPDVSARTGSISSYRVPRDSAASWQRTVVSPSPTSIRPVASSMRPDLWMRTSAAAWNPGPPR